MQSCATEKAVTLCIGDRVDRPIKGGPTQRGTVIAVHQGYDNNGRPKMAARVCFDDADRGQLAYPYLFNELRYSYLFNELRKKK